MKTEKAFADVYYAQIPNKFKITPLHPPHRDEEIAASGNEGKRREMYFAWRLLEYAVGESLGLDFSSLDFRKDGNGKWHTDGFCFSLSHTDGLAAVAVSTSPVGVDCELVLPRELKRLVKRALSEAEREELLSLEEPLRCEYFIKKWTQKESVFKRRGGGSFIPSKTDTEGAVSISVKTERGSYWISVSAEPECTVRGFKEVNPLE